MLHLGGRAGPDARQRGASARALNLQVSSGERCGGHGRESISSPRPLQAVAEIRCRRVLAVHLFCSYLASMSKTEPFSPPDEWVELFRRVPELSKPRVLVSLSAGRGAYRAIRDLVPQVSRVSSAAGDGTEVVTLHVGEYLPGDAHDVAASLYADAATEFLATRRGDGAAHLRVGRLRLQLLDGDAEIGSHSLGVEREAFGAVDDLVETGAAGGDALRVLEAHSKTLGAQFVALAKLAGEQSARDREGIIDATRGAIAVTVEASEYRAAAAAELAAAQGGGFWSSEAGALAVGVVLEQVPALIGLVELALKVRGARLAAGAAAAAPAPAPAPAPKPKPKAKAKAKAVRGKA